MSSQDSKNFSGLADQIEDSLETKQLNPCDADPHLLSFCLTRLKTLKQSRPSSLIADMPCHLTEIDGAIQAGLAIKGEWNESFRNKFFDQQIVTLDSIFNDCRGKEKVLEEAVVFLRAIVVGLDQYKLKVSQGHRH